MSLSAFCEDDRALDELLSGLGGDFLSPTTTFDQSAGAFAATGKAATTKAELRLMATTSEPLQATTSEQPAAKPKKKRVRRQKLELDYLRGLVGKLEDKMTELKNRQSDVVDDKQEEKEEPAPSIWKGIAERQLKERERAEEKNQKLRVSLEGQLKLATKLEKILRKRPRDDELELLAGVKRFKPVLNTAVAPTDDEIFADQYEHVMHAHLDVERLFGGPDFANQATSFCDMHVMNDPSSDTGVSFVTKANAMLPFDVHVAEKAFWRTFAEEGTKDKSYFLDRRVSTDDLASCSYGLYFDAGSFHTNVRGKQTYRKYVDGNRVIFMWKSIAEPVEINDTKFYGLKCIQTGWIILRGVNLMDADALIKGEYSSSAAESPLMSTSLQSYSKMTLELQDDIVDQELQVGALTDFVVNSHDTINEVCGKMIDQVLVEEDWNLNGWLNNIAI